MLRGGLCGREKELQGHLCVLTRLGKLRRTLMDKLQHLFMSRPVVRYASTLSTSTFSRDAATGSVLTKGVW